jgi:hypothetical protein
LKLPKGGMGAVRSGGVRINGACGASDSDRFRPSLCLLLIEGVHEAQSKITTYSLKSNAHCFVILVCKTVMFHYHYVVQKCFAIFYRKKYFGTQGYLPMKLSKTQFEYLLLQ